MRRSWSGYATYEGKSDYIHLPAGPSRDESLLVWSKARSDWMLIEMTPWKSIVHGGVRLAYILIAAGLTAIFIASFFTLFLSRQFTKPIRLLLSIMNRLPAKDAVPEMPTDYSNEFGQMFQGYRRQMERIQEAWSPFRPSTSGRRKLKFSRCRR
ncbi:methyl-accepting chemotaxis protein [Paenibacillus sp. P25]|nr:methyl-accepting chemotaxis protein [Paenibacillus sp. P25]